MALIMVLNVMMMVTGIVLMITFMVRTDRLRSFSYLQKFVAEAAAKEGVEQVRSILVEYTTNQNIIWVSQPGALHVSSKVPGKNEGGSIGYTIPLSSGVALKKTDEGTFAPYVLNQRTMREGRPRMMDPQGSNLMMLKWVYIRENGEREVSSSPELIQDNPIVSRYAFWVDDESARLDLNIVGSKVLNTNGSPLGNGIDFKAIPGVNPMIEEEINRNATNAPLLGEQEYKRLSISSSKVLDTNRFNIGTRSGRAEGLNPWGKPKIMLTTQANRALGMPFLNVLVNENRDPNYLDAMNGGGLDRGTGTTYRQKKYYQISQMIITNLTRTDWPTNYVSKSSPHQSFAQKYGTNAAVQFATDLIDYVRCAEATNDVVSPAYGAISTTLVPNTPIFHTSTTYSDPSAFQSRTRRPLITEMAMVPQAGPILGPVPGVVAAGNIKWNFDIYLKFYLPYNYGLDEYDLTKLIITNADRFAISWGGAPFYRNLLGAAKSLSAAKIFRSNNGMILRKGEAVTFKLTYSAVFSVGTYSANPPTSARWMVGYNAMGISGAIPNIGMICAPFNYSFTTPLNLPIWPNPNTLGLGTMDFGCPDYPVPAPGTPVAAIPSLQLRDPTLGNSASDWEVVAVNTLSDLTVPCRIVRDTAFVQDLDETGNVSLKTLRMPYPRGHTNNPEGVVQSLAELGRVPIWAANTTPVAGGAASQFYMTNNMGFKTLRLQPSGSSEPLVSFPDWAILDLFTLPVPQATNAATFEQNTGKTNYQYLSQNWTKWSNSTWVQTNVWTSKEGLVNINSKVLPFDENRRIPLQALLKNISTNFDYENISRNISEFKLANRGVLAGTNFYVSPAQLTQIKGVADQGEFSEENLVKILSGATTRGSAFRVYSVGQTISQTKSGDLLVKGEYGIIALLEREREGEKVSWKTRYWKQMAR